jgi:hypothetical protein
MKTNLAAKPEPTEAGRPSSVSAPQPNATDTLVQIAEIVMRWRAERPALATVARACNRASGLLRLDRDERLEVENGATIALAKKLGLMS